MADKPVVRMCTECGMPIIGPEEAWHATFVTGVIGWTHGDRHDEYYFHKDCYSTGREKLLDRLRKYRWDADMQGLGPGSAHIDWDFRDLRDMTFSSDVESMSQQLSRRMTGIARKEMESSANKLFWVYIIPLAAFFLWISWKIGYSIWELLQ